MTRQPVTLLDVAREAGVSRTTASAALGGSGRISETTRAHIRSVATQLGYRGNTAARHLRRGRTGIVGVHLPRDIGLLEYYMAFVFGAAEGARDAGYALSILPPGEAPSPADVDGLLIVDALADDPTVAQLVASGTRIVASERMLGLPDDAAVVVEPDHRSAVDLLFDHLLARGAKAPAMISGGSDSAWGLGVERAYLAWCADHRVQPRLRGSTFTASAETVGAIAGDLLDSADPPDAIVGVPDGAALGVLDAARSRDLRIGRDLLVAAAVDSTPFRYVSPGITALDHHPSAVGRRCAELLLGWIFDGEPPRWTERVGLDLVVRASTAPS